LLDSYWPVTLATSISTGIGSLRKVESNMMLLAKLFAILAFSVLGFALLERRAYDCARLLFYGGFFRHASRIVRLVAISGLFVFPAYAGAQERSEGQDQQGPQQQTSKGETVNEPPPPLFSKHRRGMYENGLGLQVIDATPQSPPLEVDDPGVPEKGHYEINLTTQDDFSKQLQTFDFLFVDANYGILPKILGHELPTQVKFEFPLAGAKEHGDPFRVGIGAAQFGLKFNFYNNEHKGVSVSFYPQIEFAVLGTAAVEKNLVNAGQRLILPLLVRKEFKYLTFVVNCAVNEPIQITPATPRAVGVSVLDAPSLDTWRP
jgi:hypothetical protein